MITNKLATLLATGALALGALQAKAATIEGTIEIGPRFSTAEVDMVNDSVTFVDSSVDLAAGNAIVSLATGEFSGYLDALVQYEDFTYNPLTVDNPIWELVVGGLSFDLTAITSITETSAGIILTGTGTVDATAAGYDLTPGTWSFSANTSNGGASFSFSSTVSTVPDGGATAMLLGLGVLGMAGLRRKLS